jgi:hypothetical protein
VSSVLYAEKAFLQLMARRLLRYRREAEARGEAYHDVSPYAPLQCGAQAKYKFESAPFGYRPVLYLQNSSMFQPSQLTEIASEILGAPVKLRTIVGDDLEYVRETDVTSSSEEPP